MPHDVTQMWNGKYGTNEPTLETETDLANKLLVAKVGGGGVGWEFGVGRCKLLHLGWINNNHKTARSYYIPQETISNLLG